MRSCIHNNVCHSAIFILKSNGAPMNYTRGAQQLLLHWSSEPLLTCSSMHANPI